MDQAEAGLDDAADDVGGFRGIIGVPGVGDGFGDAAELDDGEFASELALEGVDAAAELGDGHGSTSRLSASGLTGFEDFRDWGMVGFWEIPLISAHFLLFE